MSSSDDNMTVRYSAKELFAQVNTKLDVVLDRLEAKADHETVVKLTDRVDILEEKSRETEVVATALLKDGNTRWTRNQKIGAFIYAVSNLLLGMAALGPDVIHRF